MEKLVELYLTRSVSEIMKIYNCSRSTIYRELKKSNVKCFKQQYKITKDDLLELYTKEKKSIAEIAKIFNCSTDTIFYDLKKFDIIKRDYIPKLKYDIKKETLEKLYIYENKYLHEIAEECNCGVDIIIDRLKRFNIKRNRKIAARIKSEVNIIFTDEFKQILEGEMLGDGSITAYSANASFRYDSSNKEYTSWLCDQFIDNGVMISKGGIAKRTQNDERLKKPSITYSFGTLGVKQLLDIYNRWHKNGKKIIPKDLVLTPLTVRHWYIGDGSLAGGINITLCTDCFTKEENEFLSALLNKTIGINSVVINRINNKKKYHRIYIKRLDCKKFLNYIGECPVKSYKYKWNYKEVSDFSKLGIWPEERKDVAISNVADLYFNKKLTQKQISNYFNCNIKTVQKRIYKYKELQK